VIAKRESQINRGCVMKMSVIILVLVGFGCSRDPNETATAVAEHRQKFIALGREYEANYPAILYDEPRRYALVQAKFREQAALVRLGYLIETNIQFRGEWSQDLAQALRQAPLIDEEMFSMTAPFTTNGLTVTRVTARPADVQTWKRIIEEHDTK
jgi:hypothetical protein